MILRPFKIAKAWYNVGLKALYLESDITEALAKERAGTCDKCPHKKKGKVLTRFKDSIKEAEGFYCGECLCPLIAKLRSSLPCEKWKK
tara:strand:+ start:588 stop:851 length:264 start_codon:yes stop_codon:yes gene_type:complete